MPLTLQIIEDLAPDQSSLAAAKKLLASSNWPLRGQDSSVQSIWGQCKGSGANPYLTMADIENHGYKCTCPSRKFPCKHVLALMWMFTNDASAFAPTSPPEWVSDWLSRRRRPTNANTTRDEETASKPNKDIQQVVETSETVEGSELNKKQLSADIKQARAEQSAQATQLLVLEGLAELELWIQDQLRTGILGLCKELRERTRRIAARLVDAKAVTLAARVDELSSIVAPFVLEQQSQIILQELGCWLLLSRAYKLNPNDPDARRAVIGAESKVQLEALLHHDPDEISNQSESTAEMSLKPCRLTGRWLCIGEQIAQQRNGLVSHASFLWPLDVNNAGLLHNPAMLLDHYPASAGKRVSSLRAGVVIEGELMFYPSPYPHRALLSNYQIVDVALESNELNSTVVDWQHLPPIQNSSRSVAEQFIVHRQHQPWLYAMTTLMGPCQLYQGSDQRFWLKQDQQWLKLSNINLPEVCGGLLQNACIRWNGREAELLTAVTHHFGVIPC